MAGIVTSGSFPRALELGVRKWYEASYNDWSEEWSEIFTAASSDKQYEDDVGESGFGLATVKPEGQGIDYDDFEQNFAARYTHKVYAKGFIITREAIEDDQYNRVGQKKAKSLARSLRQTKETVGANILNRGHNSSYTMGGNHDGVELFSSAHPSGPYGGTYANELTTAAELSEASLEDACIAIAGFTDPRGLKIRATPRKLVIPRQLLFVAERLFATSGQPGTANNDVNAHRSLQAIPGGYCVNHYLTDTNNWFLLTDVPDGLICMNRRGMEFGRDNDFDTENMKFKATERYSFGWSDPRGAFSGGDVS